MPNPGEPMRYMVDTELKIITAIGMRTVGEIIELRKIVALLKGYTLEFGGEPSAVAFNAFSPPEVSEDGAQVRKRKMGYKRGE